MPSSDELLHEELRQAYAAFGERTPAQPSIAGTVAKARRARRRHRLVLSGAPVAALLVLIVALTAAVPRHRPGVIGSAPVPGTSTSSSLPDLGRVGDYVATFVPDTTVQPVRFDQLTYDGGRCGEIPGSSATEGCWSPLQCQADTFVGNSSPCNVSLTLQFSTDDTAFRQAKVGHPTGPAQAVTTAVTVMGSPGFLLSRDGFFNDVTWRLRDGRVALAHAGNISAADVLAFADGLRYRPAHGAPAPTPSTVRPSPVILPADAVDARPDGAPPVVRQLGLPQEGSAKAVTGNGWSLAIQQGSSRGAASVAVNASVGHGDSSAFVYSQLYGSDDKPTPIPLRGLVAVTVADLVDGGTHRFVVSGAVPRGTTGVGVLDSAGHRTWATLVDPGAAFDTLFFVYEPAGGAGVSGLQSFGSGGPTGAQRAPFPTTFPADASAQDQVHRAPGEPVTVAGLTVSHVPAGLTIAADPCSPANETATQACWGGKIADFSSARAALATYGVNNLVLDVQIASGADHGLDYATGTTVETLGGVPVTELDQGPAVVLTFRLPSGAGVLVRGINLQRADVVAVAAALVDG